MTTNQINLTAVGLFSFNVDTGKYDEKATARLQDDGKVVVEGVPTLVARLRKQAISIDGEAFVTDDGKAYLMALIRRFTDPHLKAMPLKS